MHMASADAHRATDGLGQFGSEPNLLDAEDTVHARHSEAAGRAPMCSTKLALV